MKKLSLFFAAMMVALALNATTGPVPTNVHWDGDTAKWDLPILGGDSTVAHTYITFYTDEGIGVSSSGTSAESEFYANIFYPGLSYYYTVQISGNPGDWESETITSEVHIVPGLRDTLVLPDVTLNTNGKVSWGVEPTHYSYIYTRATIQQKIEGVWYDLISAITTSGWSRSYTFEPISEPGIYRAVAENLQGTEVVARGVSEELVVAKACNVHFDANGKLVNSIDTVVAESSLLPLPKITESVKTDRLLYWSRNSDGSNYWDFTKDTITSDTTLYAQWLQWDLNVSVSQTECTWVVPAEAIGVVKYAFACLYDDKMNILTAQSSSSNLTSATSLHTKMSAGKTYYIRVWVEDLFDNIIADTVEYFHSIAVESVELNVTEPFELTIGGTRQLEATVLPDTATNKGVVWSSEDEDVLTVADGLVTAVAEGKTNVVVKSAENDAIFAKIEITVKASTTAINNVELDALKPQKIMVDGIVYILRGDKVYNMQGIECELPTK